VNLPLVEWDEKEMRRWVKDDYAYRKKTEALS